MTCDSHKKTLTNYNGSLDDLSKELGDLHYQTLTEFLVLLADKIQVDGLKDMSAKRYNLANSLFEAASLLRQASMQIDKAWEISKPFMTL